LKEKPNAQQPEFRWARRANNETFVQGSTAEILLNFCAKNLPLRQAPKR